MKSPEYIAGRCPYHPGYSQRVLTSGKCETCGHLVVPLFSRAKHHRNSGGMAMMTQSLYHGGME